MEHGSAFLIQSIVFLASAVLAVVFSHRLGLGSVAGYLLAGVAIVIVAGLGRVGQVVARLLHGSGYEPTILDDDADHVEQSRRFGFRVFYGDATRLDLLEAAGAAKADFLIVTLNDPYAERGRGGA